MSYEMENFDMHHVYQKPRSIPAIMNKCHVIQIRTFDGKKICSCIYDNDTLQDLYQKCYDTLFRTTNVLRVEKFDTTRDEIPNEPYQIIHDIMLFDKKENMLAVPCDPKILFCDFKRSHERYFVPSSQISVLSVYKIFVVDKETVVNYIRKQENQQPTLVDKMKRFISCAF